MDINEMNRDDFGRLSVREKLRIVKQAEEGLDQIRKALESGETVDVSLAISNLPGFILEPLFTAMLPSGVENWHDFAVWYADCLTDRKLLWIAEQLSAHNSNQSSPGISVEEWIQIIYKEKVKRGL